MFEPLPMSKRLFNWIGLHQSSEWSHLGEVIPHRFLLHVILPLILPCAHLFANFVLVCISMLMNINAKYNMLSTNSLPSQTQWVILEGFIILFKMTCVRIDWRRSRHWLKMRSIAHDLTQRIPQLDSLYLVFFLSQHLFN